MSTESPPASDWLADLNPEQRAAAEHGDSPLLILAGAGTGKTTTLVHRVAALIARGVDPRRLMLLTFTRRAAAEMIRRAELLLLRTPIRGTSGMQRQFWGGTFHAVGTRLLRQHGRSIGLDAGFTVIDRGDAEDLINLLRTELGLGKSATRFPQKSTCLDIYSRAVNSRLPLAKLLPQWFPACVEHEAALKHLFEAYVERKEQQQILDYDDLLTFWAGLLADPVIGPLIRSQFDHVLVDEYQDTNVVQAEIIRQLRPDGVGLTVVGDDAQSIYSFRAATVRNILDFPNQYPNTQIITLEQNYRSTQPILTASNRIMALASEGHRKELWSTQTAGDRPELVTCLDETEQSAFVIQRILAHRESGVALQKQAVLMRAGHHSASLEIDLTRHNIPFRKFGGLKFVEASHVKDLLAFLKLAENPRDSVAAMRALLLLPGIGPRKASQLTQQLIAAGGDFSIWQKFTPPAATALHWPLLIALMKLLARANANSQPLAAQVHQVRQFYNPLLEQKYDHAVARKKDLEQLEEIASRYGDRLTFLTELTLDPPATTQEYSDEAMLDDDYLILSTIHSAKGLEWDVVYVLHVADGNIPSDMATRSAEEVEEERRLFYVACTRARSSLYLCQPLRYYFANRYRGDEHSFAQRTRFIPESILGSFRVSSAAQLLPGPQSSNVTGTLTTGEIRKRFGAQW